MRIRLRPYHPTYVVGFFGMGGMKEGFNRDGFNEVLARIRDHPDLDVEFVEGYDDVCDGCERRAADEDGSIWGTEYTCPSAQDPDVVAGVKRANERVLNALGLRFGSVIAWRDLVQQLAEKIPVLDDPMIGGPGFQENYEKGLAAFRRR